MHMFNIKYIKVNLNALQEEKIFHLLEKTAVQFNIFHGNVLSK